MFTRKEYKDAGPGIDRDAPEKTGFALFGQILQLECVTLVKLNVLFLLTCIPVVTIPPALFAMNQVVRRMVLDRNVDCLYHYKTAFKKYWKTAYAAFFLSAVPLAGAGYGASFYLNYAAENIVMFLPFMLCSTVFLVALLTSAYLYGVLSLDEPLKPALRTALILGVGKPLRGLLAAVSYYIPLLLALMEFPISVPYLLLMGFSVPCLLGNFFLRTVLKQYCGVPAEPDYCENLSDEDLEFIAHMAELDRIELHGDEEEEH
jgi:uncharacterized membrane protein YesL